MKKLKNENALVKGALRVVMEDAVRRKVVEFEPTDSADIKTQYVYRLLVHDKKIIPLPNDKISLPAIRHRLATWILHELPEDHPLRQ